jgi:hypothetical protein
MAILTGRHGDTERITSSDYKPSKIRSYVTVGSEGKQTFVQGAASGKMGSKPTFAAKRSKVRLLHEIQPFSRASVTRNRSRSKRGQMVELPLAPVIGCTTTCYCRKVMP